MQIIQLLTVAQVQERLNVSYPTVMRMIAGGKLPAAKIGREWRFEPEDVERYIKSRKTPVKQTA